MTQSVGKGCSGGPWGSKLCNAGITFLFLYFKCKTLEDSIVTILTFKWQKIPAVVLLSFFFFPLLCCMLVMKSVWSKKDTEIILKICFIRENEDGQGSIEWKKFLQVIITHP